MPQFGREIWGANVDHPDVNREGFNHTSTLDILGLFITDAMFEKMLTATNVYGNIYIRGWKKDADMHELKAFLVIVLFMGLIGYPSRKDLFGLGPCRNDFVRSIMQRDRFEQMLHAWHYEDYSKYTAQEIVQLKKNDPFWPVTALTRILQTDSMPCIHQINVWTSMKDAFRSKDGISAAVSTKISRIINVILNCTV